MSQTLSAEQKRYEQHRPLRTLMQLSVGPVIYMVGIAIHDAIDLLLISKAYTETEVTIVGLLLQLDIYVWQQTFISQYHALLEQVV